MEPIITSAVQEDGSLHSWARRRGRKVDPGPVAHLRHVVVRVIRLRQLGQQVSVPVIPGLYRADLFHDRRLVGSVINGERVERPEADWRADSDAQLISGRPAQVESDDPIFGDEWPSAGQSPAMFPSVGFFDFELEREQLFSEYPGEEGGGLRSISVHRGVPGLQIAPAKLEHL